METYARAAQIVSSRNLDGGVVCKCADALPFLLATGQTVYFVPPTLRGVRHAQVERIQLLREGAWEVHFAGVDTIDAAEQLVGSYCLVAESDVPDYSPEEAPRQLLSWEVQDKERGALGCVTGLIENPAQVTLVVEGDYGEVLIPFVDEFVERLDEDACTIVVDVPESLLQLNA